jgi:hypothetical protein
MRRSQRFDPHFRVGVLDRSGDVVHVRRVGRDAQRTERGGDETCVARIERGAQMFARLHRVAPREHVEHHPLHERIVALPEWRDLRCNVHPKRELEDAGDRRTNRRRAVREHALHRVEMVDVFRVEERPRRSERGLRLFAVERRQKQPIGDRFAAEHEAVEVRNEALFGPFGDLVERIVRGAERVFELTGEERRFVQVLLVDLPEDGARALHGRQLIFTAPPLMRLTPRANVST